MPPTTRTHTHTQTHYTHLAPSTKESQLSGSPFHPFNVFFLTQVLYMGSLLTTLADPQTCLQTAYARQLVAWLNDTNGTNANWWGTWTSFQVLYV